MTQARGALGFYQSNIWGGYKTSRYARKSPGHPWQQKKAPIHGRLRALTQKLTSTSVVARWRRFGASRRDAATASPPSFKTKSQKSNNGALRAPFPLDTLQSFGACRRAAFRRFAPGCRPPATPFASALAPAAGATPAAHHMSRAPAPGRRRYAPPTFRPSTLLFPAFQRSAVGTSCGSAPLRSADPPPVPPAPTFPPLKIPLWKTCYLFGHKLFASSLSPLFAVDNSCLSTILPQPYPPVRTSSPLLLSPSRGTLVMQACCLIPSFPHFPQPLLLRLRFKDVT